MPTTEPPHDVLAAEKFALPGPDPRLHHGPVRLPDDPSGITEPHDVLAAEAFALPAADPAGPFAAGGHGARRHKAVRLAAGAGAALLTTRLVRRLRG